MSVPVAPTALARLALLLGLVLMAMGQTVLFALFGPLGRDMGLSEIMVGGVISLAAVAVFLTSPWWGRQSDLRGRRPVFLFAMAGLGLTTLGFTLMLEAGRAGWVTGIWAFVLLALARVIYGLSVTGAQPAAAGWIADITTPEERTGGMAMIGAAYGVGAILGPVLAWMLSGFGLLVPLYAIGVMALAIFLLASRALPETRASTLHAALKLSPLDSRLRLELGMLVIVFVVISSLQQTLAFYVQDTGGLDIAATVARVGQALALLALVMFATQVVVALRKPSPKRILRVGLIFGAGGTALLLGWPEQPGILLSHAMLGFGMGLVIPGLQGLASLAVDAEEQGAVAGFVAAAMAGGFVLGPVLGTGLYGLWQGLPYLLAITLLLLCAALHLRRMRPEGPGKAPA